jgi:hypothetical protein
MLFSGRNAKRSILPAIFLYLILILIRNSKHIYTHFRRFGMPHTAKKWIHALSQAQDLRELPLPAVQAVMAIRCCVIGQYVDRDPINDLINRFGSPAAAQRFLIVFEAIGTAWPDPFTVSRPCCCMLSFDEALFAHMVVASLSHNQAAFDRLTCDLLNSDARATLFATLNAFQNARIGIH